MLGTGTPAPSTKRAGSGYMVEVGDDVILFDHGPGAYQRLLESGVPPTRVTHLFFSHLHFDHCVDYARLVLTRWDQASGGAPELKVHGPAHTARMTDLLFGEDGVFGPDIAARTNQEPSLRAYQSRGGVLPRLPPRPEVTAIESGSVVEGEGWRVEAISVPHAQPYLESFGYVLRTDEGAFAYSGDAGPSKSFARLAAGADVMAHMCYQISGTVPSNEWTKGAAGHLEVAEVARDAGVKTVVVTHISDQMDVPGVRERLIAEMAEIFDGAIVWGEDLMEVPLEAPLPRPHRG